ncbi:MAG TPA: hypothetical protein VLA13_04705 [Massilibacterium sp.]|nr:hypothetical protein [Massilibacterium sp.]
MKRVIGTKILAKEVTEKELDSGIVLADTVSTEKTKFEVYAIGYDVTECTVKDLVWVPSQVGRSRPTINVDGEELTILEQSSIVLVETK